MKTELQNIEEKLACIGTYRVRNVDVQDVTSVHSHRSLSSLMPELVRGPVELEYTITVIVTPHDKAN